MASKHNNKKKRAMRGDFRLLTPAELKVFTDEEPTPAERLALDLAAKRIGEHVEEGVAVTCFLPGCEPVTIQVTE